MLFKGLRLFCALVFCATSLTAQHFHHVEDYRMVKIPLSPGMMDKLSQLGLETDHGRIYPNRYWIHQLSPSEELLLQQNHINYTIPTYDELNPIQVRNEVCPPKPVKELNEVDNFRLGTMGGYFTLGDMEAILDTMRLKFPHLISARQPIDTFLTLEGRPIQWLRMSNNPDVKQDKPAVLYTALHHAREPMSLSQLIYFMWYMLENYESDPQIKAILDETELYFVPCINPDGYNYNRAQAPNGGGMWRKNRWKNAGDQPRGVDINRNYGANWGFDDTGSSPFELAETFRGVNAFSEPETRAIRHIVEENRFSLVLNYHTWGNYLIYPWGHVLEPNPDFEVFKNIAKVYSGENEFLIGNAYETVGYFTNGGSDDWIYQQNPAQTIFSFTPEVGHESEGFWPNKEKIVTLSKSTLYGNILFAMMAHGYYEVTLNALPEIQREKTNRIRFSVNKVGIKAGPVSLECKVISGNADLAKSKYNFNMNPSEHLEDFIELTPKSSTLHGEEVVLEMYREMNGVFAADTFTFTIANEKQEIINNGTDINKIEVIQGKWGIDSDEYYSPPTAYSDSPRIKYSSNTESIMLLKQEFDIPANGEAYLSFAAKYDIEPIFDYAQVFAEKDGVRFPLCGQYTKTGSVFQDIGQPVYDGNSDGWLHERIQLKDFKGQRIKIGFAMVSDTLENRNGIAVDDITVTYYSRSLTVNSAVLENLITLYPNPASNNLTIESTNHTGITHVTILNVMGKTVFDTKISSLSRTTLDVSQLLSGNYTSRIGLTNGLVIYKKWTKI